MNQYVRTNKHKDRNFSYNEWANRWINTYEQLIIKKALIAMNEYKKTNKHIKDLPETALFINLKKSFSKSFFAAVRWRVLKLI